MRISKTTSFYLAITYISILASFYLFLSHHYSDNYLSPFYSLPSSRENPYAYTDRLLEETAQWLAERQSSMEDSRMELVQNDLRGREVCLVTPTKKRRGGKDYLSTSLGSVVRGMNTTSREDLTIIAFFVEGQPGWEEAKEEGKLGSNGLIDIGTYMGDPRTNTPRSAWLQDEFDMREGRGKGLPYVIHFLYGLELCLSQTDSPWILWLEDDVIARPDWFDVVRGETIPAIKKEEEEGGGKKTLFTMLFWSESHMFWANEDIPVVMAYYIIPGMFLLLVVGLIQIYHPSQSQSPSQDTLHKRRSPSPRPSPTHRLLLNLTYGTLTYLLLTPYISLYLYTGKLILHSPLPHNGLSPQIFGSCCSQAILFDRRGAEDVMDPMGRVVKMGSREMFDRKGPDSLLFDLGSPSARWTDIFPSWRRKPWSTTGSEFIVPSETARGTEMIDLRGSFGRGTTWLPGVFQHIGDVSEYRDAEMKGRLKSWSFEVGMEEMMQGGGK